MNLSGKVSYFGGPDDSGVSASEDLALYWEESQIALHPELFLDEQPPNTTGLARRLNPEAPYVAVRWSYEGYSKDELRDALFVIYAPDTGRSFLCRAVDWGPHEDTDRIADISPGLMDALGIETDDEVTIIGPVLDLERQLPERPAAGVFPYPSIVISSGHSTKCQGAIGILNEVQEATRVVDRVAEILDTIGVAVETFHDTVSTSQNENLNRIVDFHNAQARELDVSVHFNANVETESPMGTECLFLTQEDLAGDIADAVSEASGLKNRGPKERTDLFFLNHTEQPAILIEVCFVDSSADAKIYKQNFDVICASIANVLSGGGNVPVA